jgi:hypothetical protein
MREFTFSIDYEAGTDPKMDVFIDHPSLVARGLHGCVNDEDFWRINGNDNSLGEGLRR